MEGVRVIAHDDSLAGILSCQTDSREFKLVPGCFDVSPGLMLCKT